MPEQEIDDTFCEIARRLNAGQMRRLQFQRLRSRDALDEEPCGARRCGHVMLAEDDQRRNADFSHICSLVHVADRGAACGKSLRIRRP